MITGGKFTIQLLQPTSKPLLSISFAEWHNQFMKGTTCLNVWIAWIKLVTIYLTYFLAGQNWGVSLKPVVSQFQEIWGNFENDWHQESKIMSCHRYPKYWMPNEDWSVSSETLCWQHQLHKKGVQLTNQNLESFFFFFFLWVWYLLLP